MTDLHLTDVITLQKINHGKAMKGICRTCSTHHTISRDDFTRENLQGEPYTPRNVTTEILEYVATMRAWNCCHENTTPLDGLPEQPTEITGFTIGEK